MFIFGGVTDTQQRFNDLFQFEFEKREWTLIDTTGCIPTARTFHKLIQCDNMLFLLGITHLASISLLSVLGGFDGERRNDTLALALNPEPNV